jgi:hypothetical protein
MVQVAVCSQTNTENINTAWAERTIVKIFNLLVHPVTSRLQNVKSVQFRTAEFCVAAPNIYGPEVRSLLHFTLLALEYFELPPRFCFKFVNS